MVLKYILPKYVHFNGLNLSSALEHFLSLYGFWVQKCKNKRFEENKGLGFSFFFKLKHRCLQHDLANLKNQTFLKFCL